MSIHPFEAIPNDAAFVLQSNKNGFEGIKDKALLFEEAHAYYDQIHSQLLEKKSIENHSKFLYAGFINPQSGFDYLYIFEWEFNSEKISSEYNTTTSEFRGRQVVHIENSNSTPISFCVYQNLLLVSPKAFIVEDAIRHLEEEDSEIYHSNLVQSKESKNHLYLNLEQCQEAFKSPKHFNNLVAFQAFFETNKWIGLSLPLSKIHLSTSFDNLNHIENKDALIPDDVLFYSFINLPSLSSPDLSWIVPGAIISTRASDQPDWKRPISLLIPFSDESKATLALNKMAEKSGRPSPISYLNYEINRLPQKNPFESLFRYKHEGLNKPYFTILEKHVLFSSALEPHQLYLDKLSSNQTLANNIEYLQFKEKNIQKELPFAYCLEKGFWTWLNSHLRSDIAKLIRPKNKAYSFINFRTEDESIAIDKSLAQQSRDELQAIWKQILETKALGQAKVIYASHLKKHYILIQDQNHLLYCFDEQGVRQWQKNVGEEILSNFYLVDYQKNGQFQILFNTENTIHLLDFEGKDKGIYPREFRSKASNGLVCFDKDNHKNYVYFLASKNKKIYGYQINGSPLSAWNPMETDYVINSPASYFFDDKKDYINFVDRKNRLLSYDLKGEPHFSPHSIGEYVGLLANDIHIKSKRYVAARSNGKLKIINLEGKSFNLASKMPGKIQDFIFTDITGDDRKDYIVLSGSQVKAFAYNELDKFEEKSVYTFDLDQHKLFPFKKKGEAKNHIGVLNKKNKQVHIISSDGEPMDGFPIEASEGLSTFTHSNIQYVVAIKDNEMICYKY